MLEAYGTRTLNSGTWNPYFEQHLEYLESTKPTPG